MKKVANKPKAKLELKALTPKGSVKKCVQVSRKHCFRLFVAGATPRSHEATLRVRQMCESKLKGRYTLEVIDIYQQPELVRKHQIVATPTLIREKPKPLHRFIGSLAVLTGVLAELNQGMGRIQL